MNAVATIAQSGALALEKVLIGGDLSQLNPAQRIEYYNKVCESAGLNPLTRPFEYLTLNSKLTLYARKDCTDQLRKLNGISIQIVSEKIDNELLTIHVKARDQHGREDEDYGVVSFPASLKGENGANAKLKCVTKAKRRVTLSISGLGFLDETEVEDIPSSAKGSSQPQRTALTPPPAPATTLTPEQEVALDRAAAKLAAGVMEDEIVEEEVPHRITSDAKTPTDWAIELIGKFKASTSMAILMGWMAENEKVIDQLGPKAHKSVKDAYAAQYEDIASA